MPEEHRYMGPTGDSCTSGCAIVHATTSYLDKETKTVIWVHSTGCRPASYCPNKKRPPPQPAQPPGLISKRCFGGPSFCIEEWTTPTGGRITLSISSSRPGLQGVARHPAGGGGLGWQAASDDLKNKSWKSTRIQFGGRSRQFTWVYR